MCRASRRPAWPREALGLAESPPGDLSFGQHRCRLVAEALWECFRTGRNAPAQRVDAVAETFRRALRSIWSGRTSAPCPSKLCRAFDYDAGWTHARRQVSVRGRSRWTAEDALISATGIGDALCREAYWDGGRCNWLGRPPLIGHDAAGRPLATVTPLGPDLYAGTAGVAVFLARLHTFTGEALHAHTAEGAARHALAHLHEVPARLRLGLHVGHLGVAHAVGTVGRLLGEDALVEEALHLAGRTVAVAAPDHPLDLMSGSAGAIGALLGMSHWPGGEPLAQAAQRLGADLVGAANRDGDRLWWDNCRATGRHGSRAPHRPVARLGRLRAGPARAVRAQRRSRIPARRARRDRLRGQLVQSS